MNFSRRTRVIAILAVPALGVLAAAAPAVAAAGPARQARIGAHAGRGVRPDIAPSALAGFVWSDAESYYDYNSTGGAITVTANDPDPGLYAVSFAGLQAISDTSGDVQVTAYDSDNTCSVAGWGAQASAELVDVACYTPSGSLVTTGTLFDLTITQPTSKPSGVYDFAWISPDNKTESLTGFGEYNSAGKVNKVTHLGTGRYQVFFPGPKSAGRHGTAKVTPFTPFGDAAGDCVLAGWTGTRKGEDVNVDCYSASGAAQNREFDVVYASANNVLGLNGLTDANAVFSGAGPTLTPTVSYFSGKHAGAVAAQDPVGFYEVMLPGAGGNYADFGGDVQVSAVSSKDYHCNVDYWAQQSIPNINLLCYNAKGHLQSVPFAMDWVVQ